MPPEKPMKHPASATTPSNTLDTMSPQRDTKYSMPDTDNIVPYMNIWNVLRTPVLHQNWDGVAESDVPRLWPTLADFTYNGNLNQTFVKYLPNEETLNLVQWSPNFAEYSVNGGHLNPLSTVSAHEGSFAPTPPFHLYVEDFPHERDFGSNVLASAVKAIANFILESKSWKRFYRTNILSSAVSKDGHLSFLVPSYREVCVKTAARDHVVHLEVITLAEEQEAPGTSAVGQMLISGGKSWMRMISSLLNLFLDCSEKVLSFGFIGAGLNFANAEVL